jgi:hypothetical protein
LKFEEKKHIEVNDSGLKTSQSNLALGARLKL